MGIMTVGQDLNGQPSLKFYSLTGTTALMTAGRLFFSDRYGYRFCVAPQRNKKHDNQLNHTSHPLSDGVLTAVLPYVLYL